MGSRLKGLNEEAIENLIKAGSIAADAREYSRTIVRPGEKASIICTKIEEYIIERGGKPAFPCNISIGAVAAHYTPSINDDVEIKEGDVVKIDVGVSIDGYIADTATTIDLSGSYVELLEASREALEAVVGIMKPNIRIYDIGKTIESTVKKKGYKVIRNLTGHTIDRYVIHAGLSIPNYPDRLTFYKRLTPGMQVAIEPFTTNGKGMVTESSTINIYAYTGKKPRMPLNQAEREMLDYIINEYYTLPFTPRWLVGRWETEDIIKIIKSLYMKGVLHGYPVLIESGRGAVAQFEHTFIILKDRVIVTTCRDCG